MPKSEQQRDTFNAYHRDYRKQNPEKIRQWRLQTYVHALQREGYTVIPPQRETSQNADNSTVDGLKLND